MSLINELKQELIEQKNILEEKGIAVNTAGNNPSPSEITTALSNIDFGVDPSIATATPEDVLLNKTFYAGNFELKTGAFDPVVIEQLQERINIMVSGCGRLEIHVPTEVQHNRIQEYAYAVYNNHYGQYYKQDLTIPDNIKEIGTRAFYKASISGTLVIPSSCTYIGTAAFQYNDITELFLHNGLLSGSSYTFSDCSSLKKATLYSPINYLSAYTFSNDSALEELYLPETMENINSTCIMKCSKLKIVKFTREEPCYIPTGLFSYSSVLNFLVPYRSYHKYFTATNYQYYNTPQYGYGDFTIGTTLPSQDSESIYNITWYCTFEDAQAKLNAVTTCPENGTYYAVFTEIDTTIDGTIT